MFRWKTEQNMFEEIINVKNIKKISETDGVCKITMVNGDVYYCDEYQQIKSKNEKWTIKTFDYIKGCKTTLILVQICSKKKGEENG